MIKKKISLQKQVQVVKQRRRDGQFRISDGCLKPWPLVHRTRGAQEYGNRDRVNFSAEISMKKKSIKEICVSSHEQSFGGP